MAAQQGKIRCQKFTWPAQGMVKGREGGEWLVLSRQKPGQSRIGEYGVEANVPFACVSIRNMAVSYPECQSGLFSHKTPYFDVALLNDGL